jgi:hypothetical protein
MVRVIANVRAHSSGRAMSGMIKIAFSDQQGQIETLWARDLGDGRYRLDSSPWYQY